MNVVARDEKVQAGGVLIRALRPHSGIECMQQLRNKSTVKDLTNGPGNVARALGITLVHNGLDLTQSNTLYLMHHHATDDVSITATPRIGITKGTELLWRFYENS